jgi:methionyl-tRNA formyltransferase
MIVPGLTFLAGFSARAQCYAQALKRNGIEPENVIMFGDPKKDVPKEIKIPAALRQQVSIELPDLSETLLSTCQTSNWAYDTVSVDDVNSKSILDAVVSVKPKLIIYAATKGQILNERLLTQGFPILHMHAGWLPNYRGSTTIYYSALKDNKCGVSAFFMSPDIDTGNIVRRDKYPPPPAGLDVDFVYDGALRAETMIRALRGFSETGHVPNAEPQSEEGEIFYVIHPLLKHLSLLSMK